MIRINNQKKAAKKNFFYQFLPLFLVFLLFMFFRFNNFGNRIGFGWDQEQYTTQVRQLIVDHKPVLLGPRTTNDRGFFLAPYFTYLITPFFLLTNLHPYAIGIFLICFNILFFIGSYYILSNLFSKKTAILFLLFWSINPIAARYDSVAWWPIFIPLGTLMVFFVLKKIFNDNRLTDWLILGILCGFFINMHVQFAFILFFVLISIFLHQNVLINLKNKLIFFIAFIIMFTPLIIFDFRHNFLNTKLLLSFFSKGIADVEPWFFNWTLPFKNVTQPIILTKNVLMIFFFYIAIAFSQFLLYRKKRGYLKNFYLAAFILWMVFPLIFGIYGQRPSEYYFMFLYPFIYITLIEILLLYKKKLLIFIFIILFIINLRPLFFNLQDDKYSLKFKDELIRKLTDRTKGKKFNISFTTSVGSDAGFRYLIKYYKIHYTGDWKDPLVQIKIPANNKCRIKVNEMGVIIPKELL
ncbi:MAG: hypothetical protein WC741_01560 [Patescibacteria group bacterium]|jgi:hypothetical protein